MSSDFGPLGGRAHAAESRGAPLCLAFTNTVHDFGASPLEDDLNSYADFVAWARRQAVVDAATSRRLLASARLSERAAETALARARMSRSSLYRIFSARVNGRELPAADLTSINAAIRASLAGAELAEDGNGFSWRWPAGTALDTSILWPIARSAARLLTSDDLDRVLECNGKTCTWLVLDTSKNHSRKFCSALGCGNRTRVRRHYERVRAAKG